VTILSESSLQAASTLHGAKLLLWGKAIDLFLVIVLANLSLTC